MFLVFVLVILLLKYPSISKNKNDVFRNEILESIESNKSEFEELAAEIIELNKFISRDELQFENQIPNEVSIGTKNYSVVKSLNETRVSLPNDRTEYGFYDKFLRIDSINISTIESIKNKTQKLDFYDIKIDTFNTVTFILLKCYSPIECNHYHLKYSSKLRNDESFVQINDNLYFKTVSTYFNN